MKHFILHKMTFLLALLVSGCALFSPGKETKPFSGLVICIDPGHGGQSIYEGSGIYTGGTKGIVSGLYESEVNLNAALALRKNLLNGGATVIMTRTMDSRVSGPTGTRDEELRRRVEIAEENRAHMIISLHHNYSPNPNLNGPSIYYYSKEEGLNKELAKAIHREIIKALPGIDQGVINKGFSVLANTRLPSVIIEFGYMSNPEFDRLLLDRNFRLVEAEAVYQGLLNFIGFFRNETEVFATRYYDPDQEPSPTVQTRFGEKGR
jgi:N-acetylmuramoyl-L-alanine amidase